MQPTCLHTCLLQPRTRRRVVASTWDGDYAYNESSAFRSSIFSVEGELLRKGGLWCASRVYGADVRTCSPRPKGVGGRHFRSTLLYWRIQGMSNPGPCMPHSGASAEPTDSGDNVTRSARSRQMAALVVDVFRHAESCMRHAMARCSGAPLLCLDARSAADAALLQWFSASNCRLHP